MINRYGIPGQILFYTTTTELMTSIYFTLHNTGRIFNTGDDDVEEYAYLWSFVSNNKLENSISNYGYHTMFIAIEDLKLLIE